MRFVVGHGDVEVFDLAWEKTYYIFPVIEAKLELDQDGLLRVQAQSRGELAEFYIRHDHPEIIQTLFAPKDRREAEAGGSQFKPEVEAMLRLATGTDDSELRKRFRTYAENQGRQRCLFFTSKKDCPELLVMCICAEFKMRFPQIEADSWAEAFEVLYLEFIGFVLSLWQQCFGSIIAPHSGPNSREYFRRLAANAGALICRGADVFAIDWRPFALSLRKYLEGDPAEDLPIRAREVLTHVERALGNVRKRWILQLADWFEYSQLFSCAVHIASSLVDREIREMRQLTDHLSSWSAAAMDNRIKPTRHGDFRATLDRLSVEVLKHTDADRYKHDFHCTLALWKLAELVKAD